MQKYSFFKLLQHSLSHHKNWQAAWRNPAPAAEYDVVIVGGGGHGLASAYYLAKVHGVKRIAVIEKGWLGGGNTGRNTTVIRSNYLRDDSARLYEHSLKLWEGLSQELNYNVMFSQRGLINLAHSHHEMSTLLQRHYAMIENGIESEVLNMQQLQKWLPNANLTSSARYPVIGGIVQRRGGTARHDAVAWGYARGADALGVDIIQQCEVQDLIVTNNEIKGVETTKGTIRADKVLLCAAGHSGHLTKMAGLDLPMVSVPLQALVSEPMKPCMNTIINDSTVHAYISQSDKGELVIGASNDQYLSYSQRGSWEVNEETLQSILELYPVFSRVKMMRHWAGIVDITPDRSPLMGLTDVKGLYLDGGWGTGGFKATPGAGHLMADTVANDKANPLVKPFGLDRFTSGRLVDEGAASGVH